MWIQGGGGDTANTSSHGSDDLDVQSGSNGEDLFSMDLSDARRLTVCDSGSEGHRTDSSDTSLLWGMDSDSENQGGNML